jgi:hypothetical protein
MQTVSTIGLDIAKSVFQVHGVDAGGQVVNQFIPGLGFIGLDRHRVRLLGRSNWTRAYQAVWLWSANRTQAVAYTGAIRADGRLQDAA